MDMTNFVIGVPNFVSASPTLRHERNHPTDGTLRIGIDAQQLSHVPTGLRFTERS
jgi:hypothetical protein